MSVSVVLKDREAEMERKQKMREEIKMRFAGKYSASSACFSDLSSVPILKRKKVLS